MTPLKLAKNIAKILDNKKAVDLKVIKIDDLTVLADYFVIAGGTSTTQIRSLADEVEATLEKNHKTFVGHREGVKTGDWVLLDYGSIIVHIFSAQARDFYNLEQVWKDGEQIDLSEVLKD